MDRIGIDRMIVGGHSFGALLSLFLAARYPDRVSRVVMLDAAATLHHDVRSLIAPSLARLMQRYPSADAYIALIRSMPFLRGFWHPLLEGAFRAELEQLPEGQVAVRTSAGAIAEALDRALDEPWEDHVALVRQPVLLVRAPEGYGPPGTPPILPESDALATVRALHDCRYVETSGNHLTMLFGEHATRTAGAMQEFLAGG
jgi:pimeloyl-ACP methyl ester carboxylesterase